MLDEEEIIAKKQLEGGKTRFKNNPELPKLGGTALWKKPGMREHLSKKRREQSASGRNPMQGKKQNRVCCIKCRKETSVNNLARNHTSC